MNAQVNIIPQSDKRAKLMNDRINLTKKVQSSPKNMRLQQLKSDQEKVELRITNVKLDNFDVLNTPKSGLTDEQVVQRYFAQAILKRLEEQRLCNLAKIYGTTKDVQDKVIERYHANYCAILRDNRTDLPTIPYNIDREQQCTCDNCQCDKIGCVDEGCISEASYTEPDNDYTGPQESQEPACEELHIKDIIDVNSAKDMLDARGPKDRLTFYINEALFQSLAPYLGKLDDETIQVHFVANGKLKEKSTTTALVIVEPNDTNDVGCVEERIAPAVDDVQKMNLPNGTTVKAEYNETTHQLTDMEICLTVDVGRVSESVTRQDSEIPQYQGDFDDLPPENAIQYITTDIEAIEAQETILQLPLLCEEGYLQTYAMTKLAYDEWFADFLEQDNLPKIEVHTSPIADAADLTIEDDTCIVIIVEPIEPVGYNEDTNCTITEAIKAYNKASELEKGAVEINLINIIREGLINQYPEDEPILTNSLIDYIITNKQCKTATLGIDEDDKYLIHSTTYTYNESYELIKEPEFTRKEYKYQGSAEKHMEKCLGKSIPAMTKKATHATPAPTSA